MAAKQMLKADLAAALRAKFGAADKDAEAMVSWFFDTIADQVVAGGSVVIRGFGGFHPKHIPSRKSFNFAAGRVIETAPKINLHFTPAESLAHRLKGKTPSME